MAKKTNTTTTVLATILVMLSLGIAAFIVHKICTEHGGDVWNIQWRNGELYIDGNHYEGIQ